MSAEFVRLYQAIMSNDEMVYSELIRNSNILRETVRHSEDTLLHVAANWNRRHIAEIIIDLKRSLLFATNAKGETPLHVAASAGSEDVTRLIRDRCCQIEAVERLETGETILRKKTEKEQDTALHKAVRNGHLGVVKLLIDKDPELTKLVNKDGDSPLFMAIDTWQFQIARSILKISDCSFKGRKNMNALHATIAHRHSRHYAARGIVPRLIEKKEAGLLEQQDEEFGWTPLHYAAHLNDTQTMKRLLLAEHSVACIKDKKGMTALHIAAKQGHVGAVGKLVKNCPEICGIVDDNGQSFFHIAVKSGRIIPAPEFWFGGCFYRQLFGGDFLNMQDCKGNTALHLAASENFFILLLLAMDRRFSKATTNSEGLTVLDILNLSHPLPFCRRRLLNAVSTTEWTPGIKHHLGRIEIKKSENPVKKSLDRRQINLMVATITATVSFTAGLSVPGGFKNNGPYEGTAALAHNKNFRLFTIFNTIAFYLSVTSILLTWYTPKFLSGNVAVYSCQLGIVFMAVAFIEGTSTVLGPPEAGLAPWVFASTFVFFTFTIVFYLVIRLFEFISTVRTYLYNRSNEAIPS